MVAPRPRRSTSAFDQPVTAYMVREIEIAHPETPIEEIAAAMDARRISGVPIVDTRRALVGVVTRTDLLALGVLQAGRRAKSPAMPLPPRKAREVMTADPQTISIRATLRDAATVMATHAIHRVFVVDNGVLAGVIGAVDIAAAVHDAKIGFELQSIMTSPLATVAPRAPLGTAVDLLDRLRVTALIVIDDDKPVGLFTQVDALAARDLPRDTPIAALYDPAMVCLPATTPLYVAAGQVARLDVRRVVVCKRDEAIGLVTALDFARWVAW
jgi:CBS domain-containing protein